MKRNTSHSALWLSLSYLAAGALWILFSDRLVEALTSDPHLLTQLQTYKGWFFVLASALLVYALTARFPLRLAVADEGPQEGTDRQGGGGLRQWLDSFGFRLTGLVLLVLIPMLIVVVLEGVKERQEQRAEAKREARLVLRNGLSQVQALMESSRQLLLAISHSREVRTGQFEALPPYLAELLKLNPRYLNIGISDARGKVLASALPAADIEGWGGRRWLERAVRRKDFFVTSHQASPFSPVPTQLMAYAVTDATGAAQCVVWVTLSLDWLRDLMSQTRLPPGSDLSIVDDRGTVLARSTDPQRWLGRRSPDAPLVRTILAAKEGTAEVVGLDGIERLHAFAPVFVGGGVSYLTVGIPTALIYAPVNRALTRNLTALTAGAALVLLLAWAFAEMFILRNTRALVRATRRLQQGDLTARSGVPPHAGELGQLGRAFDEMAASLQKRTAERDRAEREVRESHRLLQALVETAPSLIVLTDRQGRILQFNRACEELTGYTSEEVIGRTLAEMFLLPDWIAPLQDQFANLASSKDAVRPREIPWRTRSGETRLIEWRFTVVPTAEGQQHLLLGTGVDITERKRAEDRLLRSREQLRSLATRLRAVREEERTRLAREIHDHLGQLLTALKMDLRLAEKKLAQTDGQQAAVLDKLRTALALADETITSVQKIATELRPGVLDRLGLTAAIELEASMFQERTGITCLLELPEQPPALDAERATSLFRILQEILTNVARHAHARRVQISLQPSADHLILEVTDDGKGITEADILSPRSLGLLGIRERAAAYGGEAAFCGVPGHGTTVTVRIPNPTP